MFIASGLGPFSGQAVHFQHVAPVGNTYGVNRYRKEIERHYKVMDDHLAQREFVVGDSYTIADMSLWGWIERSAFVMKNDAPLDPYPKNLKKWYQGICTRPAVERARKVGSDHAFKSEMDDLAKRALFPSNYS